MSTMLTKSTSIEASRERVFDAIANPARLPDWIPSLIEVHGISGEGIGQTYEWAYKMVGLRFRGRAEVIASTPPSLHVYETIGGVESTWTYELIAESVTRTHLSITIDYEVPVAVLQKLAERLVRRRNSRELEAGLEHLKEMLEL